MEHCTGSYRSNKIDSYRFEQRRTNLHWHFVGRVKLLIVFPTFYCHPKTVRIFSTIRP